MPFSSTYPPLDIPETNILSYLFPYGEEPYEEPIWFDSKDEKVNLSPKTALQWVRRLAFGLKQLGLKNGNVVMIYTPNHIFVPVAYLGIVGAGYIFSGANPTFTIPELVHQITNTMAKVILAHPQHIKVCLTAAAEAGFPRSRIFQFSDVPNPTQNGIDDWRAFIGSESEGEAFRLPDLSPSESKKTIATINYSSGTTGLPKGVCVSHYNLIANVEQVTFMRYAEKPYPFEARPQERWIGFLPLYHAYGQLYTILLAMKLRVPVYIMTEFRFEELLFNIEKYRITSLTVVPPILIMLAKRPEPARYDLSSLRDCICGAAPLSRQLQNEVQKQYNMQINQGWGQTEVTCGAMHVPGGIMNNTSSVGQLDPNCECKLVDDGGKEVPIGQPGEMSQHCMGYWRNEQATRETIDKDGWLKTGDIAINDNGYFWIVDRKKEMIKVNAFQVAPAELEGVLLENKHVADAAVVGISVRGEEFPRAYVVIREASKSKVTPEGIQEWIKPRVAKHKLLTGGVQFVDEVPKLASGKIQRKILREWARKDAAATEGDVNAKL
ncbi:4-coumarate-CoA ligase 2 [Pseudomassariella vexata]|uniref:4-coumarate-CoA ligase 2 n=1 Tax=Pseudomassariella vexata TaxID=1141098 RepID=A0A1Y2EAJ7_9PEZI|nr:4-coumarate-CoA ligase 2 [Pseudomassariella vexata]ORY68579.1 4-coumarate-CoA ligase 2 [Pseudomassariella vexata]